MVHANPEQNFSLGNFAYHLYKPSTNRFSHVNGKRPICSENLEILVRIQMAQFILVEIFRKKGNTFRGISFFSVSPDFLEISVPFCTQYQCHTPHGNLRERFARNNRSIGQQQVVSLAMHQRKINTCFLGSITCLLNEFPVGIFPVAITSLSTISQVDLCILK